MSRKLPRYKKCERCGRTFRPSRCNAWHQVYCTDPLCVAERKRERQRKWYARKRSEAQFREAENARCAEANRRRRAAQREEKQRVESPEIEVLRPEAAGGNDMRNVMTGLLAQLLDTSDPVQLRRSMDKFAERGRRAAVWGGVCGI